jgi:hypothetical protein
MANARYSADSDVGLPCQRAGGEGCQQLRWLASGAGIALFSIVLAARLGCPVFSAGLAALLVGIGMGILKYRVYDMDRIISRTLACAIVTGLLAGVCAGLVLLAAQVFGVHAPVAAAACTLAAATLSGPLRRRVQQRRAGGSAGPGMTPARPRPCSRRG